MTAKSAAVARGATTSSAYLWAMRRGKTWPSGRRAPSKVTRGAAHASRRASAADCNAEWAKLHAAGMTAVDAARIRGRSATAAYAWAQAADVRWARATRYVDLLTNAEAEDYRVLLRNHYTAREALAAIGRSDLIPVPA